MFKIIDCQMIKKENQSPLFLFLVIYVNEVEVLKRVYFVASLKYNMMELRPLHLVNPYHLIPTNKLNNGVSN